MKNKSLSALITFLRILGIINSISLAAYILSTSYLISPFKADIIKQAYMGTATLAASSMILIINIFAGSRIYPKKAWMADIFAAVFILAVLIYFSFIVQPEVLKWFMPLGLLLPIPVLLSAAFDFIRKTCS